MNWTFVELDGGGKEYLMAHPPEIGGAFYEIMFYCPMNRRKFSFGIFCHFLYIFPLIQTFLLRASRPLLSSHTHIRSMHGSLGCFDSRISFLVIYFYVQTPLNALTLGIIWKSFNKWRNCSLIGSHLEIVLIGVWVQRKFLRNYRRSCKIITGKIRSETFGQKSHI